MTFDALPLSVTIWLVQMVAFHALGLGFHWIDTSGRLDHVRVRPIERLTYVQLLPRVLANQVFVLLPAMMAAQWLGIVFTGTPHVSVIVWIVALIAMPIGHDVVQYVTHRYILHRASLMRPLGHAVHHTTAAGRSISACYMSLPDYFFEIVCPYLIPLALIGGGGSDFALHATLVTLGAFGGLYEHSGYDLSLLLKRTDATGVRKVAHAALAHFLSNKAHQEHHTRGNVSFSDGFGSSSICDTVMKTRWDMVGLRQRQRTRDASPVPDAASVTRDALTG